MRTSIRDCRVSPHRTRHYLLVGVAGDALGTQTPVGYVSLPIEHDDREGRDTLDQEPVPLLGLTQSFQNLITFSNLALQLLVRLTEL
jgi:hypothetical protein